MKKSRLFLLPVLAMFLFGCDQEMTLEHISMNFVNPDKSIINSDGGEIQFAVTSTHSFGLTTNCPSDVSFFRDGEVNYNRDGVALVTTYHNAHVSQNTGDTRREVHIYATQNLNQDISASLIYFQAAKEQVRMEYLIPTDGNIDATGGTVRFAVKSTHPFDFSTNAPSVVTSFQQVAGSYTYNYMDVLTTEHEVTVGENTTGAQREIHLTATHRHNTETTATLVLVQSAQ